MSNPLVSFVNNITKSHDLDEFRHLCFEVGVQYDNLAGDNKLEAKTRELILYMGRRRSLDKLITTLQNTRPHLFTQDIDHNYLETLYAALPVFSDNIYCEQSKHDLIKHSQMPSQKKEFITLIIEDVPSQQRAIQQVLSEIGADVTIASDFESALGFIRLTKFDLITLDMQLDEMDTAGQVGIMLLDQIRTYQREAMVIIISGLPWTASNVRDFFRDYKAYDYLEKPFKPEELQRRIQELLR